MEFVCSGHCRVRISRSTAESVRCESDSRRMDGLGLKSATLLSELCPVTGGMILGIIGVLMIRIGGEDVEDLSGDDHL